MENDKNNEENSGMEVGVTISKYFPQLFNRKLRRGSHASIREIQTFPDPYPGILSPAAKGTEA